MYTLKKTKFKNSSVQIALQNENGPCPLLAIANYLLLTQKITLHSDFKNVSAEQLISLISDYLVNHPPNFQTDGERENYAQNLDDCMCIFPKLTEGLPVNVKFGSIFDFEFTADIAIFDLLGLRLVHGWLVDPEYKNCEIIKNYSYNQAIEKIASMHSITLNNTNEKEKPDESEEESNPPETDNGKILQDWILKEAPSQLTYYGMIELHRNLKDEQFAVFFRNNHFSTIYKHDGNLYLLVTDQGFANQPNIVWEILNEINGNTQFLDSDFILFKASETSTDNIPLGDDEKEIDLLALQLQHDDDASKMLALKLQDEEDESKILAMQLQQEENRKMNADEDYAYALQVQYELENKKKEGKQKNQLSNSQSNSQYSASSGKTQIKHSTQTLPPLVPVTSLGELPPPILYEEKPKRNSTPQPKGARKQIRKDEDENCVIL